MVAHNCRIGRHNMLCSQVGIAGSTSTGDYVVMAGQVGVRDHVHIGDRAVLGAMAGVVNDVPADVRMIGIPATPERDQKLKQAAFSKLPKCVSSSKNSPGSSKNLRPKPVSNATSRRKRPPAPTLPTTAVPLHNTAMNDSANKKRIGIMAGWGRYPVVIAQALNAQGYETYCLGVVGHADPQLAEVCHEFHWLGLAKFNGAIRYFQRHDVTEAMMAGQDFQDTSFSAFCMVAGTCPTGVRSASSCRIF